MRSPQALLIALLAVTTAGGALLAWQQYGELVELRASAMNRDERADLQKRIWDLEKMNRELRDQLAAALHAEDEENNLLADAVEGERPANGSREGRGGRGDGRSRGNPLQQATALRELMSKPEVQAMLSIQQKAAIEARYAALFRSLNLNPEQSQKLTALLAERGTTRMDVMAAAREQGIDPRENPEALRKLFADAQNQLNDSIKAVIGDSGFSQLQNYEQTMPQRSLVNDLQQRLSSSSAPLSPAQADALVQILATNAPQRQATAGQTTTPTAGVARGGPPGFGGPGGGRMDFIGGMGAIAGVFDGGGRGGAVVTAEAVAQAQSILTPSQLSALQQVQQQQQAQQQLQKLVRETLSANQPSPSPSGKRGGASADGSAGGGAVNPRKGG